MKCRRRRAKIRAYERAVYDRWMLELSARLFEELSQILEEPVPERMRVEYTHPFLRMTVTAQPAGYETAYQVAAGLVQ